MAKLHSIIKLGTALTAVFWLSGCAETQLASHIIKGAIEDRDSRVPKAVKIGKPYKINGKWYKPAYDPTYSQVGIASWYGPNFHGKMTANGEIYNQNDITAAHPTLPIPSLVRVTNLENGRSLIVRVNDRGPFARGRVIDLSKRSASLLGFETKGTAQVKVDFLEDDSRVYWADAGFDPSAAEGNMAKSVQQQYQAMDEFKQASVGNADYSIVTPQETSRQANVEAVDAIEMADLTPIAVSAKPVASLAVAERVPENESFGGWVDTSKAPLDPLPVKTKLSVAEIVDPVIEPVSPHVQPNTIRSEQAVAYIQAGSFGEKHNATKAAFALANLDNTQIDSVRVGARTFYRVRVGPVENERSSEILDAARQMGFPDARIVLP